MRIVQINHFSYKAAGHIMMNIHHELLKRGIDSYVVWGRGRNAENEHEYYMNDDFGVKLHAGYTRLTDRTGFASVSATKKLLKWLDSVQPDMIHLHCIHGYYINIELLFDYIRKNNIRTIWTQHDCWSFTGHCAYFDAVGCEKWKNGCYSCEQLKTYPASFRDASQKNWKDKKRIFSGLDITLVTPCHWLKELIGQSFLSEYPTEVIYNGIDLDVFKRSDRQFRAKNHLEKHCVILGVASEWSKRKGLDDFLKLNKMIDHDKYKIIIVGLTPKQASSMPENIIAVTRTNNVSELADIYSSADVFFNPTYEDNFPTTNIEALACGTPIVTYKTGGSPEAVQKENGIVVDKGNIEKAFEAIKTISKKPFDSVKCDGVFAKQSMIESYLKIYMNGRS